MLETDRKSVFSVDSLEEGYQKVSPLKDENETANAAASTSSNVAQVLQGDSKTVSGYGISQGHAGLQHSGEFHDTLFINDVTPEKPSDETGDKQRVSLQHSGEMHDSIGFIKFDEEAGEDGDDEDEEDEEEKKLQHSGEMHDTIDIYLSSEELAQGQVYVIIVSCLTRYISFN